MPTLAPRAFALTVPGLGPLLQDEARELGLRPGAVEHDGRADVVVLSHPDPRLRTAEDAFELLAVVRPVRAAAATAAAVHRALRVRGQRYRLVVRVRDESLHRRRDLRDALAHLPWATSDERAEELWCLEVDRSRLLVGRRRRELGTRSAGPRAVDRAGALRPAVAAAMVRLTGRPSGRLLDPCCGTGTIVAAASAIGWSAIGGDVDPGAHRAARAGGVERLLHLDARQLPLADGSIAAVVSNLPFGERYEIPGAPVAWYRRVLQEALRVAPKVVVLAPPSQPFRRALGRLPVDLEASHPLVLLGQPGTIWVIRERRRA